jgi:hypothetical protein
VGNCHRRRPPRCARRSLLSIPKFRVRLSRLPGRLAARISDEAHSQICGDDARQTSARPAPGRTGLRLEPWSTAANRRPRSLTDFIITIKTHSQLLSTKTDSLFRNGVSWYDRGAGRASAVLRKLRVRHCQSWQAIPDRIAPTHQRL